MTLLGAVRGDGFVLIGADSLKLWTRESYGSSVEKLRPLGRENVVWGCFGAGAAIIEFEHRVEFLAPFVEWENLDSQLPAIADHLNREFYRDGGFGVLFAGVLDDGCQIRAFGTEECRRGNDWCFLGTSRLAAQVSWEVVQSSPLSLEDRFSLVMRTVIDASDPALRSPLHVWRVSDAGCEHIGGA